VGDISTVKGTPEYWARIARENVIEAIEIFEGFKANPGASPADVKNAMYLVMSQMFALLPKTSFVHKGKKYTRISNSKRHELVVTEITPKKIEKPSEDAGEFKIY
jgi:hypothetical protein